ncbi:MAG: hypothetical protein ACI83W_000988 [Marinoscillum sp.]|jgi:hypothetical protein
MKNVSKLFYLFILLPFLISCSDEEGGEGTTASLVGAWTYQSATIDLKIGNEDFVTYIKRELQLSDADAAEFKAIFEEEANLFAGISLEFKSGGAYTASFDGDSSTGTWALNSAGDKLTLDAGTEDESVVDVYTLTNSSFVFGITETEMDDFNGDNVDETLSISIRISMKK